MAHGGGERRQGAVPWLVRRGNAPCRAPNAAPRRNYYLFGRPFDTTAVDPTNADACDALYGAVRTQVELQMEYLLQRRGDDPYDDFVKRLAYEVGGSVAPTFPVDE